MSEFKYIFKNRNAKLIIPDSGKFRSTRKPGGVQLTGVDYIPPMNAITLNPSSIGLRSFRGIADVPVEARDNFSWINPEHIRQYKSELNLPADIMSPIYNQAKCGSCWAVAVAQAFSDRWAIANKTSNPMFSPTFLLSCTMKYQQETSPFKELFPNSFRESGVRDIQGYKIWTGISNAEKAKILNRHIMKNNIPNMEVLLETIS